MIIFGYAVAHGVQALIWLHAHPGINAAIDAAMLAGFAVFAWRAVRAC